MQCNATQCDAMQHNAKERVLHKCGVACNATQIMSSSVAAYRNIPGMFSTFDLHYGRTYEYFFSLVYVGPTAKQISSQNSKKYFFKPIASNV